MVAARANMTTIVKMLHDPRSQMMDMLLRSLEAGKLCVVDVSQMRGAPALVLSGLILQKIFDHNQEEFTKAEPSTIPTVAVIEEAQSVLGSGGGAGEGPYVAWVKEGRKYDLGAVMITQQPGSISQEILSQGDNWFVFHLLSAGDLQVLKKANAHYSDDLLGSLLNEPIPGHAVFWSSAGSRSYPVPIRILSFEKMYELADPCGIAAPLDTYGLCLRREFEAALAESLASAEPEVQQEDEDVDADEAYRKAAIRRLQDDTEVVRQLRNIGMPWGVIMGKLKDNLPKVLSDKDRGDIAYNLVRRFMDETLGEGNWESEKRPGRNNKLITWVVPIELDPIS
jgi:hypothetical protein